MRSLNLLPIRWKLALITVATCAIVEMLAVGAILIYSNHEYLRARAEEFREEAQMLSANLTAPLAFGDVQGARDYLDTLSANEGIAAAGVYGPNGHLFASFVRPGSAVRLPSKAQSKGQRFRNALLTVSRPISRSGTVVGSLYLMVNTDSFAVQLARFFGGFSLFAVIGSLAISLPISIRLNAAITDALREIVRAVSRVNVGDLDFEAPASERKDEIGVLVTAFAQMLASLREKLQHERLRALGQMSSGIAHDINNALSPLAIYTQSLLETETNVSERIRKYLEMVKRVTTDVAATVARMRDFSRPRDKQLTLAPVNLNQIVCQVYDLTRVRWSDMHQQSGIVIECLKELADDLPVIMGIAGEIREALTNLVFNAVDAMPQGGTLVLRTLPIGDPPAHVCLEVADSGVGMDEDTRKRIFEPFFTTKGDHGTGLGMAMVYGAMKRHSGDIQITTAPGRGTTVRLTFLAHAMGAPVKISAPAALATRLRILVVDDNPSVLESLCAVLELDGHAVSSAKGGESGIEVFRQHFRNSTPFDVVITDLGMPHIDGSQVAKAVKELSPSTSIILLTGWGRRMSQAGEVPRYVDHILAKPAELDELRAVLLQCC